MGSKRRNCVTKNRIMHETMNIFRQETLANQIAGVEYNWTAISMLYVVGPAKCLIDKVNRGRTKTYVREFSWYDRRHSNSS